MYAAPWMCCSTSPSKTKLMPEYHAGQGTRAQLRARAGAAAIECVPERTCAPAATTARGGPLTLLCVLPAPLPPDAQRTLYPVPLKGKTLT